MGDLNVSKSAIQTDLNSNQAPPASGMGKTPADQSAQQNTQNQQAVTDANKAAEASAQQTQDATLVTKNATTINLQQLINPTFDKPQYLSFEVLNTFQTIFQEGYENYKVPSSSQGAGVFGDTQNNQFQKDLQVVREFMREATRLVQQQGMEISQVIHWIKTDQGGLLWQRLQQVLQKPLPGTGVDLAGMSDGDKAKLLAKLGFGDEGPARKALGEAGQAPGKAMLQILKAEANPTAALENLMAALAMLKENGLNQSSEKLLGYLKDRYDLSEEELQQLLGKFHIAYWQGPMPRVQKEAPNLWYPFLALLCTPVAMLLGADFFTAGSLGLALAVCLFIAMHLLNRKD